MQDRAENHHYRGETEKSFETKDMQKTKLLKGKQSDEINICLLGKKSGSSEKKKRFVINQQHFKQLISGPLFFKMWVK